MPEDIFPGPEGRLEGRYQPPKTKNSRIALILHPHPQFGGTMNNPIVHDLYYMFRDRGFSVLRFNFRGVGGSAGTFDHGIGEAMVGAAYSSGTPALGVGVGNAVITVDDSADLDEAAEKIRTSKTLDLAASCSSDNSVLVFESIYDEFLEKMVPMVEALKVGHPEDPDVYNGARSPVTLYIASAPKLASLALTFRILVEREDVVGRQADFMDERTFGDMTCFVVERPGNRPQRNPRGGRPRETGRERGRGRKQW